MVEFQKAKLLELLAASRQEWQRRSRAETAAKREKQIADCYKAIEKAELTIFDSRQVITKLRLQSWDAVDPDLFSSVRTREVEKAIEYVSASANRVFSSDDDLLDGIL